MKKILLAVLFFLLPLLTFVIGLMIGLGQGPEAFYATAVETLTGETPEAKIGAYVQAVLRGNEQGALATWELLNPDPMPARAEQLSARREAVTRELVSAHFQRDYRILNIQWWGTCCEPRVINSPRDAGGARVTVQFLDDKGLPSLYVFDVFTRGGAYWADALGYPPRQWVLRDVYRFDDKPLYWTLVNTSTVTSSDRP